MENKTALLIVDVQNAMFSNPNFVLHNSEQVLDNIVSIIDTAREAHIPIVYIQHTDPDDEEYAEGLFTWEIHPKIKPLPTDTVVQKPTWDAFYRTNLQEELQKLEINELIMAGMQTEFCLDTTARSAFSKGYKSILVKDAHSTFDNGNLSASQIIDHHNHVLGGRFVTLKETADIKFKKSYL